MLERVFLFRFRLDVYDKNFPLKTKLLKMKFRNICNYILFFHFLHKVYVFRFLLDDDGKN